MTQSYWPFDGIDTTETQYSQLFRRMQATGVWGDPGDDTLKLVQGAGLVPVLKAGYALVRGHMYYNDADLNVAFTAGSANPRIDRLVLRLNPTANTITPVIIEGTPAPSNPAAPALTQTDAANYDLLIADVARAGSSGSVVTADITDQRDFMGLIFGSWSGDSHRPASPRKGQPGWNETRTRLEYWSGAAWLPMVVTAVTASMISAPEQLLLSVGDSLKVGGRQILGGSTDPGGNNGDFWFD